MSLRINHKLSAVNAHRNGVNNSSAQQKTMEKLSSGLKINRAADSPAQLQISENLRAQALVYASPSTIPRWLFL